MDLQRIDRRMTKLSGKVAILNEKGEVVEVRDLGPDPIEVKAAFVKPLEETKPEIADGERLTEPSYELVKGKVVATYDKEVIPPEPPSLEDRVAALEAAISEMRK